LTLFFIIIEAQTKNQSTIYKKKLLSLGTVFQITFKKIFFLKVIFTLREKSAYCFADKKRWQLVLFRRVHCCKQEKFATVKKSESSGHNSVKPLINNHSCRHKFVAVADKWLLFTDTFTL
jgi:hypothetical protein